jgi:hypothetical protein
MTTDQSSQEKVYIMEKKLPTLITDKLRFVGWKEYAGDNPMYYGYWVKDGVAVRIIPARRMNRMFHLNYMTSKKDENRFLHEPELMNVIESGKL